MATTPLTPKVQEEITKLSQKSQKSETFSKAQELTENYDRILKTPSEKPSKIQPLKLQDLKEAIYKHFGVKNTDELKKSERFKMATDGMGKLNFTPKQTWEKLYRKWIDILPNETNEQGYGCINGINIFNYSRPWDVFNLDYETATQDDIKTAFRQLSKIYHPDNQETGDRKIFERLTQMYNSLIAAIPKKS
ncbi:DnaJ domain-containing protein [Planktothrix agardhii 1801]|jgi:curved DNA-binding protein CbpA|uniref:DnaJ domain-containing protein n=1 Tax=Planktothrix agardhii TaxID=1160 RepID=UPI001F1FF35B|nr:DnaJ domain-containing protein [Planktothrix agardhii]MCF3624337.1 DnaJ domain-containing protein [Planktothrix agardhii 1801]